MSVRRFASLVAVIALAASGLIFAPPASAAGQAGRPAVTKLSVSVDATSGGTRVKVTGHGFSHIKMVRFGKAKGRSIKVLSSTKLKVTTPPHSAGRVHVLVITRAGKSKKTTKNRFTFIAAPVITKISPAGGPTSGGTRVLIVGKNFIDVTLVTFGSTRGTALKVTGAGQLTISAPARGTGRTDVRVRTAYGTSAVVVADHFTYTAPPPTVTHLSTGTGSVTGGQTLTVTGTGFTAPASVTFGATPAGNVTVTSATSIQVTTPVALPATVDVRVTTAGGTSNVASADRYTFTNPAPSALASFTPAADTQTTLDGDVEAVTGGHSQPGTADGQATPWILTLAAGAAVPNLGVAYFLPPGGAAFPTGLAGVVAAVADGDGDRHVVTVNPAPLDLPLANVAVNYTGAIDDADATAAMTATARPTDRRALKRQRALAGSADPISSRTSNAAGVVGTVNFGKIDASNDLACQGPDGAVTLAGSIGLKLDNVTSHVEINVGSGTPFIDIWVQYEPELSFDLTSTTTLVDCKLTAAYRTTHKKFFLLSDTGATLTIAPEAAFSISASGTITISQHSYRMLGFISQPDGSIKKLDAKSADPATLEASAKLEAEASAGVQIQVGELDTIGMGLDAVAGVKGSVDLKAPPPQICAEITPFIRGTVYAYLNLWVADWKLQTFQGEVDLPGASECIAAGDAPPPNSLRHVVIAFDDLPVGGTTGVVVTNQYPSAIFSSSAGNVNYVSTQAEFNGSKPNFLCTGPVDGLINCTSDTIIDFASPVNNLTFQAIGVDSLGSVAQIDISGVAGYLGTVPVIGRGSSLNPELQDLTSYTNVTQIRIHSISDAAGIGWDDFAFDTP
jgi:hypothetical protein